jgi:transposase
MRKLYWLDDEAWARIESHLPRGRRGAHRVDDHRVISGIVHMLQSGARWRDCPPEYGPYTTVYNRFNRWSRQGVWVDIFKALTGHTGVWTSDAAIDSTSIRAHRSAGGAKGGPSPKP